MTPSPAFRFRPRVFELSGALEGDGALRRLAGRAGLALLDSAGGSPARFSLLGFDPLPARPESEELASLRGLLARLTTVGEDPVPGPFRGGFLGALAYDLGVGGEALELPAEPWGFPLLAGGLYVDFWVRDCERGRTWLVLGEEPGDDRPELSLRRAELLELLEGPEPAASEARALGPFVRETPAAEHRGRIERARELIAAGEIYQANLAHRLVRPVVGSPIGLYAQLRARNRAPYMGYLEIPGHGAVLSASPELLLETDGRRARTRPIKGTAPRGDTPAEDRARAEELLGSTKDLAELAMIVDLERNDLGRVARPGSVVVPELPILESYASVHHLAADVLAELREGLDAVDLLTSLFPGGSITGAPKLRAMEAIAELEGEGRGFFSGSLGFLDTRGRACFNILIRSPLWRPRPDRGAGAGELSLRVGGGITWASEAHAEDLETLHKAASVGSVGDHPDSGVLADPAPR